MSSEDRSRTHQDSDHQETKREDQYMRPKADEDDDEGYHTPTSEEYRIPPAAQRRPPPPPRKRKLVVFKNSKKVEGFKRGVFFDYSDADIESFFMISLDGISADAAEQQPDADQTTSSPKRRHVDK